MRSLVSGLFSFFFITSAVASLHEDYELLKDSGTNFEVTGVICEQVARLDLMEHYPTQQFEVQTGIAYGNKKRRYGELDVIVFDRTTQKAVLVGEVKCWRNLQGAYKKAMSQRHRFLNHIHSGEALEFVNTTTGEKYSQKQFEDISEFISVAQKGAEQAGFTMALEHSLEELMFLRRKIIGCQKAHLCAAPKR